MYANCDLLLLRLVVLGMLVSACYCCVLLCWGSVVAPSS